jgi:hypothetical protein
MPGGGGGNPEPELMLQEGLLLPPVNGSLKGTSLVIFDGN